ncbi:MAG: alpha/beta hydrolase [Hyphomicrobiales bacterium]
MRFIIIILLLSSSFLSEAENKKDNMESFVSDTIYSEKHRKIVVYKPDNFNEQVEYPVIILTDGQYLNEYLPIIDSLIKKQEIPELILIGVFSNGEEVTGKGYKNIAYRQFEYVKSYSDSSEHEDLKSLYYDTELIFENTILNYLKRNSVKIESLNFYGYSNGAGFGITFSLRNPSYFDNVICFSTAGYSRNAIDNKEKYPKYYISYGTEEFPPFQEESKELVSYFKENNLNFELNTFNGGHKRDKWNQELIKVLSKIF